jgi:hypothetical protein
VLEQVLAHGRPFQGEVRRLPAFALTCEWTLDVMVYLLFASSERTTGYRVRTTAVRRAWAPAPFTSQGRRDRQVKGAHPMISNVHK